MDATGSELVKTMAGKESVFLEIYKDLAQPGVRKVGVAIENLFDFTTVPFLLFKFGSEAAKLNYEKRMRLLREKLEKSEKENIVAVPPEIGVPILEKLTYTTNDDIAELFVNLLAKASNIKTIHQAHPSFIQIIERLSSDEAKIISWLAEKEIIPYSDLLVVMQSGAQKKLKKYVTKVPSGIRTLQFNENMSAYLENFISIGLLKDMSGYYLDNKAVYESIHQIFAGAKQDAEMSKLYKSALWSDSYFEITSLGRLFIDVCNSAV